MKGAAAIILAWFLAMAALVFADGGSLIVRKQEGTIVISVFSAETQIRAGTADLSVMVQNASDQSAVMDAIVMLRLTSSTGGNVTEVAAPATHAKATNKTLYAAQMTIPYPAVWRLSAEVTAGHETAGVSADLDVAPAAPPIRRYWPYFALVPLVILLFVFNRWLRRKRQIISRQARP